MDFPRDLFQNIFNNYSSVYVFDLVIPSISSEKGLISYLIHWLFGIKYLLNRNKQVKKEKS